jgi:hypothetical protein
MTKKMVSRRHMTDNSPISVEKELERMLARRSLGEGG